MKFVLSNYLYYLTKLIHKKVEYDNYRKIEISIINAIFNKVLSTHKIYKETI